MFFSSAMSPDPKKADVAYHMNEIIPHLDIFNVMTYDYHGWFPEHNFTGENAPLYRCDYQIGFRYFHLATKLKKILIEQA